MPLTSVEPAISMLYPFEGSMTLLTFRLSASATWSILAWNCSVATIVFFSSTVPYSAKLLRSLLLRMPGMIDWQIILCPL